MIFKFVLFCCTFAIIYGTASSQTTEITCPENEEYTNCVDPCWPTCSQPYHVTCYFLICNKGCKCKSGYLRTQHGGPCVPEPDCKHYCLKNQKFNSCGTDCPDTCTLRNRPCTDQCVMGCFCKKGYILDELMGTCVAEKSCTST